MIDGPGKTMFGAKQLEWLRSVLVYPDAPVNTAFADWRTAQQIDGLLFFSGDRHFSELLKIERADGYPIYDFTPSPLTWGPFPNLPAGATIRTSWPTRSSRCASSA